MKTAAIVGVAVVCLALGTAIGYAAKETGAGVAAFKGKPAKEGAYAALAEAEKLAGNGSWELIGVGRVYYLSGDKAKGQALFDRVLNDKKVGGGDWQRIGEVYAEAGENAKAEELFRKVIAADPKDDTGQAEIGAWYIRTGHREKGEELFARALGKKPNENWHYVRAAEALLNVRPK
jgi:tetratricopeptide (TPR) repeat protein